MLHQYDPQTDEEMKELQDYLHRLSTTVSIPVAEEESDNEEVDEFEEEFKESRERRADLR